MRLSEILAEDLIALPMEAQSLEEALGSLLRLVERSGALSEDETRRLVEEIVAGEAGEVVRVNAEIVLMSARAAALDELSVTVGVSPTPFELPETVGVAGSARALFLLLTPRRLATLKLQVIPGLTRILRSGEGTERLLGAASVEELRDFEELMEMELYERLTVEDVLTPVSYRTYPDTPLSEIMDLMARRGVRAVPVVGERYEVLGIITTGDILKHLLTVRRRGEGDTAAEATEAPVTARDVMSRAVMCVSEDQSVFEAANLLVNKSVAQVPVVREGELIGILSQDTLLRALSGL